MADRVRIRYTFNGIDEFEEFNEKLRQIIEQDIGQDAWIETRTFPPIGFPPPLSAEAIEKLKELSGVNVEEIPDED